MGVQGDGARDAKPRTAVASRHGDDIAPYRYGTRWGGTATGYGARGAHGRVRGMSSHAPRWGAATGDDIATYRNGTATWDAGRGCGRNVR